VRKRERKEGEREKKGGKDCKRGRVGERWRERER